MTHKTSINELYTVIGAVVKKSTGRAWWRINKQQASKTGTYAVVSLTTGKGLQNQVTEHVEIDHSLEPDNPAYLRQIVWNTTVQNCVVEFYRSALNDSAMDAATRFRTSLFLDERIYDLYQISGLIGGVDIIDISSIFRADIEPRAEVRFSFYANISDPQPLDEIDVYDINTQTVEVIHVRQDDIETNIEIEVNREEEG